MEDFRLMGITSEKDANSVITSCNDNFLKYVGAQSPHTVIGRTDYELPWQEYAPVYRAHELDALAGDNYSTIYPIKDHAGEKRLFLHTKIQKNNTDGTIGIKCHAIEILNPHAAELIQLLSKHIPSYLQHFSIGKIYNNIKLSKRQEEVLFFLLRGKTAKTIAQTLCISARTVEKHVEAIKIRLNCKNKSELIEHAVDMGYLELIPKNPPLTLLHGLTAN